MKPVHNFVILPLKYEELLRKIHLRNFNTIRRMIMWEHWEDMFKGLLFTFCLVVVLVLAYLMIWYSLPTKFMGYHLDEIVRDGGRIKYYQVVAVREHSANRCIYTSFDFEKALAVMEKFKTVGEVD